MIAAYSLRGPPQTPIRKYIGKQHHFPEDVEQEEVERQKDAEHARLEDQEQDEIALHLLRDAPEAIIASMEMKLVSNTNGRLMPS